MWLEWLENDTQSELNAKKEEEDICNNFVNTLLNDVNVNKLVSFVCF